MAQEEFDRFKLNLFNILLDLRTFLRMFGTTSRPAYVH